MNCRMTGKEGMTTVELLTGLMMALILMGAASTVFFTVSGSFLNYADRSENQMIIDTICNMVTDRIAYAEFVSVGTEPVEDCRAFEFSEDGHILLDGEELFDNSFYNGRKLVCRLPDDKSGTSGHVFMLTISLEDDSGKSLYSSEIVVKLINMGISGEKIRGIQNEDTEAYVDSSDRAVYISFREVQL